MHKDTCTRMFFIPLCVRAKAGKQIKCPIIGKLDQLWHLQQWKTAAVKMDKLVLHIMNMESPQEHNVQRKSELPEETYGIITYGFKIYKNMLNIYGDLDLCRMGVHNGGSLWSRDRGIVRGDYATILISNYNILFL